MARIEPNYDVQMYNDPAIAVDVKIDSVLTMQYDGYLVGALYKGAGVEGCRIDYSDGQEGDDIPGRDIAIDTDNTAMNVPPGPGMAFNCFVLINKRLAKGTKLNLTPRGTGTAEANFWAIFSLQSTGPEVLNKAVLVDIASSAYNDTLMDCPTFMPSLKRCFIRGQGANDLTIALGSGGQTVVIPCRAVPINTDTVNFTYHSIDSDTPDKIIFVAMNGFTITSAWLYFQFE